MSQKVTEEGVLKEVKDVGIGAGGYRQWPLLWRAQFHKQRWYGLLIQQVLI